MIHSNHDNDAGHLKKRLPKFRSGGRSKPILPLHSLTLHLPEGSPCLIVTEKPEMLIRSKTRKKGELREISPLGDGFESHPPHFRLPTFFGIK
jgi:hypothetical protein